MIRMIWLLHDKGERFTSLASLLPSCTHRVASTFSTWHILSFRGWRWEMRPGVTPPQPRWLQMFAVFASLYPPTCLLCCLLCCFYQLPLLSPFCSYDFCPNSGPFHLHGCNNPFLMVFLLYLDQSPKVSQCALNSDILNHHHPFRSSLMTLQGSSSPIKASPHPSGWH